VPPRLRPTGTRSDRRTNAARRNRDEHIDPMLAASDEDSDN